MFQVKEHETNQQRENIFHMHLCNVLSVLRCEKLYANLTKICLLHGENCVSWLCCNCTGYRDGLGES